MGNLDLIFNKRYGGSVNIRGVSYQIKYSMLRAFELFNSSIESITLEGIEDLDLKGFTLNHDTFVQVKTSEKEWRWHQIQKPMINFIEAFKVHSNARFTLILNTSFKGDIEKLSNYKNIDSKSRREIENKFIRLCNKVLDEPEELLISFLDNLTIASLDNKQLDLYLKQNISEILDINTSAGDIYLSILASHFLDWAHQRKTITKPDIQNLISDAKEKIAVEEEFQAVGKGLIGKINWETDNYVNDYYEGKNTYPSHIAAGADYKRIKWLEIINKAVYSNKLSIIKGSSGQGKSSLLYRYAHDYWLTENTYKLNVLNKLEHVETLVQFLRYRANLGLPILVLIDNISFNVQYWSKLVEACFGFEINFLATIRKEDWFRYGKENLEFEVIEPTLDLEEAREIYKRLKSNGKISIGIKSAETALERIGDNKLLIEYIYFITQGEMLNNRLKDQIRQINHNNEDPVKIDILRKVSLASVCNAPVIIEKLINNLRFNSDPQGVLESLNGEYLKIENELVLGMHWVRTEHLYKILFQNYINPAIIGLEILNIISKEYIKTFISGLLSDNNTDRSVLAKGLIERLNEFDMDTIISVIEGFYIAGENHFYNKNKEIFDEANRMLGHNGPGFLATDLCIATAKMDLIERMIEAVPDKAINFIKLKKLLTGISHVERGNDFCCDILCKIVVEINPENYPNEILNIAKLLDWICFCNAKTSLIDKYSATISKHLDNFKDILADDLTLIIQSLYKYDNALVMNWFNKNSQAIINYLKYCSDTVFIEIKEGVLSFKFIISMDSKAGNVHEQTIRRVKFFQETLPFLKTVSSGGLYCLPDNLRPSNDDSIRNITPKEFNYNCDVERNRMFLDIVNNNYHLDSYYEYQEHLYKLRVDILNFCKEFISILYKMAKKVKHKAKSNFEDGRLPERILDSIKKFPDLPPQTNKSVKKEIENAVTDWSISIRGFISLIDEYLVDMSNRNTLNLVLTNLRNAIERLPQLHNATKQLCAISPDYFEFKNLSNHEFNAYQELYDLTELVFVVNPQGKINNPLEYIRSRRKVEMDKKILLIKEQFINENDSYIFSDLITQKGGLNYYAIMFTVNSQDEILSELMNLLVKLYPIKNIVNYFCLVPVKNQRRILEGYYFINSSTLEKLESGNDVTWEAFMPVNMGDDLILGLPEYKLEIKNNPENKDLLNAMILNLQCIESYKNHLFLYLDSQNAFDKALIENHKKIISNMLAETINLTRQIKDRVKLSPKNLDNQLLKDLDIMQSKSTKHDVLEISFYNWIDKINSYI